MSLSTKIQSTLKQLLGLLFECARACLSPSEISWRSSWGAMKRQPSKSLYVLMRMWPRGAHRVEGGTHEQYGAKLCHRYTTPASFRRHSFRGLVLPTVYYLFVHLRHRGASRLTASFRNGRPRAGQSLQRDGDFYFNKNLRWCCCPGPCHAGRTFVIRPWWHRWEIVRVELNNIQSRDASSKDVLKGFGTKSFLHGRN